VIEDFLVGGNPGQGELLVDEVGRDVDEDP
jgi:hypothetical protein